MKEQERQEKLERQEEQEKRENQKDQKKPKNQENQKNQPFDDLLRGSMHRTFRQWLAYGRYYLEHAGIGDAQTDSWLLLEFVCNITRSFYFLHMNEEMETGEAEEYQRLIRLRAEHVPLQYLTGEAWFYGEAFEVTPDVLIPRQDTEVLVEAALERLAAGMRILDLCTGSGCILLTLVREGCVTGVGADVSERALAVARRNEKRRKARGCTWIQGDLFEHIGGVFDMIVSNPPYIASGEFPELMPEVREHEPLLALDGRADGLYFYRRITAEAGEYLKPGGWLCMEIGCGQGEALKDMLAGAGYEEIEIRKDLCGLPRVALGRKPRS